MNELILKLQAEAAELVAQKEAAILAANADGVSKEDADRHITEAETANARLKDVTAKLGAAVETRDQKAALDAHLRREKEPAAAPLNVRIYGGPNAAPAVSGRLPAQAKKYGALKAFKGPDADFEAYQSGLFVAACFFGHKPSQDRLGEYGIQATLSTIDNTRGGYFVPDVMDTTIIRLTEEYGVIRRLASVVPMSSDTWSQPRWTGGLTAYWVSEGAAPMQSSPTWDQVRLVAKNLAAYDKISNQLNEDALVNLGDEWANMAAIAFAYAEDNAAFNGDGTSTYGGIVGLLTKVTAAANAASLVTATGHTTLSALTKGDFETVTGKFPNYPGANPRWFCHKTVYAASMMGLNNAMGGNTVRDISGRVMPTFLDYPVEIVNVMPNASAVTTGVTGILFGDPAISTKFGDRRQRAMRVTEINDDAIKQMQTLFVAERVDIVNHTVVDPLNSSNPGPMLGLKLG